MLKWVAMILSSIVTIGNYAITRRKQLWAWFIKWRKGYREDKVDKTLASRDGKSVGKLMRDILKKRNKRHKNS